jgi:rfaE bifunctional protein nucleotidyltransferase chain/domain
MVTPTEHEAARLCPSLPSPGEGHRLGTVHAHGRQLLDLWRARSVAITLGAGGAVLVAGDGAPLLVPATPATGNACGAGDCLAATVTLAMLRGALPSEALGEGVAAASRFVARGGVAAAVAGAGQGGGAGGGPGPGGPPSAPSDLGAALAVVDAVRAGGGTVVATGGCFDLLHAGHVSVLSAARRLGDCLVVCLNSDASVRRLKGAGRPVQSAEDRAAVLSALGCVDAVVVFDEDTPAEVLGALRPHVFAKGGDYVAGELPEEAALRGWGGQAVILPYLAGRSTTGLLAQAGVIP